jgi:superfamily II DNA helicase RecQ
MRKAINQFRRAVRDIVFVAAFLTVLAITYELSKIPTHFYYIFAAIIFGVLCLWRALKAIFKSDKKYINEYGYVVLSASRELEHRYLARQKLGRELKLNEIVHHINGKKTDNGIGNLCVMDGEKHELFHSWLSWKRKKNGRYPSSKDQKRILVEEYGGTLLENFVPQKQVTKQDRYRFAIKDHKKMDSNHREKPNGDFAKKLFDELRRERKRLADEKRVAAYIIFHDYTLHNMVDLLPDTDEMMSQIKGMTPIKLKMYGAYFFPIIKKFKNSKRKDSA